MRGLGWMLAAWVMTAQPAAAELTLLSTGAFRSVGTALSARFPTPVTIEADTVGGVLKRVKAGQAFDVVVLTPAGIDGLIADGVLAPGSRVDVAQVGVGVAVRDGAHLPDIGSTEAFRALMLSAPAVAIVDPASGGTSGIYLTALFDRLGIGDAMRPKLVRVQGGQAATRVADGSATVALQQLSELDVPGVRIVGPLPADIQSITVYSAGLRAGAAEEARRLLSSFTGPEAETVIRSKGMTVPGR